MPPASRIAGGTISGLGTIAANTNITGSGTVGISIANAGTVTASNGTLDLTGTVSGRTLAISSATGLRPEDRRHGDHAGGDRDHAEQRQPDAGDRRGRQPDHQRRRDGDRRHDPAGRRLADRFRRHHADRRRAALTGCGTVAANTALSGTGTVTASGGTLDLLGTVSSGLVLAIATGSASDPEDRRHRDGGGGDHAQQRQPDAGDRRVRQPDDRRGADRRPTARSSWTAGR